MTQKTNPALGAQQLSRRGFLYTVVATTASALLLPQTGCETAPPQMMMADGKHFFPQSVASGDPRADSVVIWARALNPASPAEPCQVKLQVAADTSFLTVVYDGMPINLTTDQDHTVRIKVTGLSARTTYFYRFLVLRDDVTLTSQVGRTRTAPSADDKVPVKFAFWSCQDFEGRYYNAWQRLLSLDEDLDFVLGLGDYIYETAPATPTSTPRSVGFSDPSGAILVGTSRIAASTVGQYRDLYKRYRSDAVLQKIHERYPMIVIWDDHEYSNDCWGATSTYQNGKTSEVNGTRRRNAERAFFEYMPIDDSSPMSGQLTVADSSLYPRTRLFRDFHFGQNLHLVLTDYRSFRPDHLIPEEVYPGSAALDASALRALGAYPIFEFDDSFAAIDIDAPLYARQKQVLTQAAIAGCLAAGLAQADAQQKAASWVTGNLSLLYVNAVLKATNQTALIVAPSRDMDRAVSWLHLGKQQLFSPQGSRYLAVKPLFELYAQYQWQLSQHESENVFGKDQQEWLQKTLTESKTKFRVIGSSVMPTEGIFNLTTTPGLPAAYQNVFVYGLDGWDGFPNKRQELLDFLKTNNVGNTFFVAGDIHGGFVSVLDGTAPALTTPAISSGTLQESIAESALALGFTLDSPAYAKVVANLDKTLQEGNPSIAFSASDQHGFVIVEVGETEAQATFHLISQAEVKTDSTSLPAAALAMKFATQKFKLSGATVTKL